MERTANLPWYRRLHWQILIALLSGAAVGGLHVWLHGEHLWFNPVAWFGWLGILFVRLLKMIIVPLVLTSIISGVASVGGGGTVGRLFGKTFGYYVLSSFLAILVGLLAVNLIQPGVGVHVGPSSRQMPELETPKSPLDLVLDLVPENVFAAAGRGDMLPLIFFAILFGLTTAHLPGRPRRVLLHVVDAGFQAMMQLTRYVIAFAPIGVFGLITRMVGESWGDPEFKNLVHALVLYVVTIASGLTIHLFVTLPLLLLLLARIKPSIHFRNMAEPLAMAFSTSSSGATLPVTLRTVEEKVGVSNRISSFVLPMGATVNMDGTALYECAGVLFIAQVLGVGLTPIQQLLVVFTALLASIGAAAVPSAGLVIIFVVLDAVNLRGPEVESLVLTMLAIDRPLDMYRTAVNVFSDSCGAAIIARSEGEVDVDREVAAAA